MTDRASAEGLRALRDELVEEQGDNYPLYNWVIRFEEAVRADERALRDTGPRPDSGIRPTPHDMKSGCQHTGLVLSVCDDCNYVLGFSTPRTETSECECGAFRGHGPMANPWEHPDTCPAGDFPPRTETSE